MKLVNVDVKCPECEETIKVQINLFTAEHRVINEFKASYDQLSPIVEHYKSVKGFHTLPTWDGQHKTRAMAGAKRLLRFFRKLEDPVDVAKECIDDIKAKAEKEGWSWTLETVVKRAPDWIVEKANGKR